MQARIDEQLCSGHARCRVIAKRVFRLDESGYNADRGHTIDVPAGEEEAARRAAVQCPEGAITLT